MNFYVMTLFPEMVYTGLNHSILKRAVEKGHIQIECVNIRDFSGDKHNRVDDYAYGGGAGMLLRPQPVYETYRHICDKTGEKLKVYYMSPQGKVLTQEKVQALSREKNLVLLCGHYEGIDQRVLDEIVTEEISIGDYVLTGGELAAMVVIDAVSRLIPGVLGKEESHQQESHTDGLLEYPQYTRPPVFHGQAVPDVLLSGHHQKVDQWRKEKALEVTEKKRPDLLYAHSQMLQQNFTTDED